MVLQLQLEMDKPMQMNKGFTLVESLFVIFIICILLSIGMTLHIPTNNEQLEVQNIVSFLNEARLSCITSKQSIEISFLDDQISYGTKHIYHLKEGNSFNNSSVSFNQYGHIIDPKTITLYTQNKEYSFVFQLGSGCFYVK